MAVSPLLFLQQVRTELKKVVWPTRAETMRLTLVVIGVSLAVGLYIGGLDILFVKVTGLLIQR